MYIHIRVCIYIHIHIEYVGIKRRKEIRAMKLST